MKYKNYEIIIDFTNLKWEFFIAGLWLGFLAGGFVMWLWLT